MAAALALVLLPQLLCARHLEAPGFYLGNHAPPGQATYVMMRPAGLLALSLLFLQILLGSFGPVLSAWLRVPSLLPLHKALAIPVLTFAFLHPLLFAQATTLRKGHPNYLATFFPDPSQGYWPFYFFFGALALYGILAAALSALVGPRIAPKGWRVVHGIAYLTFFPACFHAYLTGTDVRDQPLQVLYTLMAGVVACLLTRRVYGLVRGKGFPGSAGPPEGRKALQGDPGASS